MVGESDARRLDVAFFKIKSSEVLHPSSRSIKPSTMMCGGCEIHNELTHFFSRKVIYCMSVTEAKQISGVMSRPFVKTESFCSPRPLRADCDV